MNSFIGLYVTVDQKQLCQEYDVPLRKELVTKYSALKIAFPEERFHGLEALNVRYLGDQEDLKYFSYLCKEDANNLSKVGITSEKIKQVANLANYYAENYYLGKKDINKDLELNELSTQGIEFTIMASVHDCDQAKNLAFNHAWQRNSNQWNRKY